MVVDASWSRVRGFRDSLAREERRIMGARGALAVCLWAALANRHMARYCGASALGTSSSRLPAARIGSYALRAPFCCRLRGGSENYSKLKLNELQKLLRNQGLGTTGNRNHLIQRLEAHLSGAGGNAPGHTASTKRDAPEPTADGGDEDQAREKQVAVADEQRDMGDGHGNDTSPTPIVATPRVHVDQGPEGQVKVYNSYAIKDKCRAAGFQFDVAERAWTKSASAVLEQLGAASLEEVTQDTVIAMITHTEEADVAATAPPMKESEPCHVFVQDAMVRVNGGTYGIKDKLRAAGFRWDGETSSWARSEPEVTSWINELRATQGCKTVEANHPEYVIAVLAAVNELDETAQVKPAVDPLKAHLVVKDDKVFVYNSYDIKDRLRALGFRFSSAERAWSRPLDEVLAISKGFVTADDINLNQILAVDAPELPADEGPPLPYLKVVDTEVEVYNSYSIKDQLRALGFRFNVEKAAWTHNVDSVMEALSIGDRAQITIDMCTAVGAELAASGSVAASASKQNPEMKISGTDVEVYKSYDHKDKLRALGFNWNADSACWRIEAAVLLDRMEGHDEGSITIEHILALDSDAAQNKEPPRLEIENGEAVVYHSYAVKDKLRALGFRWEGSRSAWIQPVNELMEKAGVEDELELNLDILLKMDAPAAQSEGEAIKPYITCDDDEVCVFNSYNYKEKLRAQGFRWESSKAAWCRPTAEVLSLMALQEQADITVEGLLECLPPKEGAMDENGNLLGAAGASLEILNDEVCLSAVEFISFLALPVFVLLILLSPWRLYDDSSVHGCCCLFCFILEDLCVPPWRSRMRRSVYLYVS